MFDSINDHLPIFAIYLVFVSILGGPLLFTNLPCGIREIITKNLLLRHMLGFLFMFTGVVLTMKFPTNITTNRITNNRFILSSILYLIFIIFTSIEAELFIGVIIIIGIVYILYTKKEEYLEDVENKKVSQKDVQNKIDTIVMVNNSLTFITIIIVLVGFFIQLGTVKYQKGNSFNFIEYFFGDSVCIRDNISYKKALQHVFS